MQQKILGLVLLVFLWHDHLIALIFFLFSCLIYWWEIIQTLLENKVSGTISVFATPYWLNMLYPPSGAAGGAVAREQLAATKVAKLASAWR